ncbi:MAG: hypothetical protein M3018_04925 [Actinomycetota bacterium]|nr:hypothetical protein [Actinomycetota bacterium]
MVIEHSVLLTAQLIQAGVVCVEVSCGVMVRIGNSAEEYVGVDRCPRVVRSARSSQFLGRRARGVLRTGARVLRELVMCPVIAVGGMRRTETMCGVIASGDADLITMSRSFIR